jgi:hypothetical protein
MEARFAEYVACADQQKPMHASTGCGRDGDPDWSAADLTAAIARAEGERQSPALRRRLQLHRPLRHLPHVGRWSPILSKFRVHPSRSGSPLEEAERARQGELSYAARTSVLRPNAPRCTRESVRRGGTRAAYGGSSGISGGTPGGISGGTPGGISGGISGGTPGGISGGISGGTPGGISGGISADT